MCDYLLTKFRGTSLEGKVTYYHAGIEDVDERRRRHEDWSTDVAKVICATIAFGMGINKPGNKLTRLIFSYIYI